MAKPVRLAVCSLNQWAMSFESNLRNTKESIELAREQGAVYRLGPELELTGYGCEDSFLESDTCFHAWEGLADILSSGLTDGIVCDIGMPVMHEAVLYNCRVFCLNGQILLIRPKKFMANDGNYRELRWFSSWKRQNVLTEFVLPDIVASVTSQERVPFGDAYLRFQDDASLAAECCEELFTPEQASLNLSLSGVQIICNGSASHHQLRKLHTRLELITESTKRCGGVYLYSNQQGCDGGRLYYDGCACIVMNGKLVLQGCQFSLREVNVWTACIDLNEVVNYRAARSSFREQASEHQPSPCVHVPFRLSETRDNSLTRPVLEAKHCSPEEEIALGPACWLWDYLRRSGASGFLLPLSGGADSAAVSAIVSSMCQLVYKSIELGDHQVFEDALRLGQYEHNQVPTSSKEFAQRIFHTVYMGSDNSSSETRNRASRIAGEVGACHWNLNIDSVVKAFMSVFSGLTGRFLRYKLKIDGGTLAENLALQSLQARIRMVFAYLLAAVLPWVKGKKGFLLVLGSANADESLRGYLTKYDCSSADINPIGGISKKDIRSFLRWGAENLGLPVLAEVESAPPTAELEPAREGYKQRDEEDMGMTYDELSTFSTLRKVDKLGPYSMFQKLCGEWHDLPPDEVATKVKGFFRHYSANRHKMTTLTPCYHAENYSPDDNRFDQRQFLYNTSWSWQFQRIDRLLKQQEQKRQQDQQPGPPASPHFFRFSTSTSYPCRRSGKKSRRNRLGSPDENRAPVANAMSFKWKPKSTACVT